MGLNALCVISLMIAVGMSSLYFSVKNHYSGIDLYKQKIVQLEKEVEKKDFKNSLLTSDFLSFRQQVAMMIPGEIQNQKSPMEYSLRNLASVIGSSETNVSYIAEMRALLQRAKADFKTGKYFDSNKAFAEFIQKFPYSSDLVEAHYLLAEGQFQLRYFNDCVQTIENMVDLFPENELTGYALLRLGRVYEIQGRPEEAVEMYKTILSLFPNASLGREARKAMGDVNLSVGL